MTSTYINIYNRVAKTALGNWVMPTTADNDETGNKLHVCTLVTNETTFKFNTNENGKRVYDHGYEILYYAIYEPKTRKVVECGKYDTGKPVNGMGVLPNYGKLFAFSKGHGKWASILYAPIAGKKDNHKYLVGDDDIVDMINRYCFYWYNNKNNATV
ncbi:MAG: hypothetical protein IKO36_01085 [Bacteroidaceae bacterium]|nr:hypothetical protein [Bacteroidaceae bacterium]